jgi:hypothetical protein
MFFWRVRVLFPRSSDISREWRSFGTSCAAPGASSEGAFTHFGNLPRCRSIQRSWSGRRTLPRCREFFPGRMSGAGTLSIAFERGDARGNRTFGEVVRLRVKAQQYRLQRGRGRRPPVVLFGVDDLIVVRSEEAILVMPKGRAQDVKRLLKAMKSGELRSDDSGEPSGG